MDEAAPEFELLSALAGILTLGSGCISLQGLARWAAVSACEQNGEAEDMLACMGSEHGLRLCKCGRHLDSSIPGRQLGTCASCILAPEL